MEKYELDWTRYYPENGFHTMIAILTGLPIEEIIEACPAKDRWRGSDFKKILNQLGFNTNHRLIKFNPETEYPCIMRFKLKGTKENEERSVWYGVAYYDGKVEEGNASVDLERWKRMYRRYRITSMLQVWM